MVMMMVMLVMMVMVMVAVVMMMVVMATTITNRRRTSLRTRSRRGEVRYGAAEQEEEVTRLMRRLPRLAIMIHFVAPLLVRRN